ncbi:MAG: methyltransferase domain-containing protein [Polyangia bacterium]
MDQRIFRYYSDLTKHYRRYGGDLGFHYGVWDEGMSSLGQALVRANELLLEDLEIGAEGRVLDMGCGIGSFAVRCARRYGCRVVGVNSCVDHLRTARRLAKQETVCYAPDTRAYLAAVRRLLRPGGRWRAIAFSVREGALEGLDAELYRRVLAGFILPPLAPASEMLDALREAGFEDCSAEDVTSHTDRTSRHIVRLCRILLAPIRLRLDWLVFREGSVSRSNHCGHFDAGDAYSRGLLRRSMRHQLYRARRPDGGAGGEPEP